MNMAAWCEAALDCWIQFGTLSLDAPRAWDLGDSCISAREVAVCYGRGKRLHARNQHLRNYRGFSVALFNIISLFSGIFQRIVTLPVDYYWNFPMDFHWHYPMAFHFYEIWRVIFCPDMVAGDPSPSSLKMKESFALLVM